MPNKMSMTREKLLETSYGPALLREADLVIAANVLASMEGSYTLYQDELSQRVSDFCRPLDTALDEQFLGVIPVPQVPDQPDWKTLEGLHADLATKPRGHWAIYCQNGGYDSWISNGFGGVDTKSGHKFNKTSPLAPALSFDEVYGDAYSWLVYNRRYQILREIYEASVATADLQPGTVVKNASYGAKEWNVTFLGDHQPELESSPLRWRIQMSRRGVKSQTKLADAEALYTLFKLTPVLPEQYRDDGNPARLRSLRELREAAAQSIWDKAAGPDSDEQERQNALAEFQQLAASNFDRFGSRGPFAHKGDTLERNAYAPRQGLPIGPDYIFSVDFEAGSAAVKSCAVRTA